MTVLLTASVLLVVASAAAFALAVAGFGRADDLGAMYWFAVAAVAVTAARRLADGGKP